MARSLSRAVTLFALTLVSVVSLAACGGSGPGGAGQVGSQGSGSGSESLTLNKSDYGQVTITGALNTQFGVATAQWNNFPGDLSVWLDNVLCRVSIDVPHGTKTGTYQLVPYVTGGELPNAQYSDICHGSPDGYVDTGGTVTFTSIGESNGDKWSGTFEFTAKNDKDSSKTIQVKGSFKDVPGA